VAPLVTNVLFLAVPLYQFRVRLPTLFLVIGVFVPPLLLAIAHHLAILDIRRQLLAARIRAALALTIRPTANSLLGTVPRREKEALAVKTTAGLVHVDSSWFKQKIPEENRNAGKGAREIRNGYVITDGNQLVLAAVSMLQKMWS